MERTWIVVCDASHCRFFLKRQASHEWVKFEEFENDIGREKGLELTSDRPGRRYDVGPNQRSAVGGKTEPRANEEFRFAHSISKMLNDAYNQNAFDRLILVAPPQFLGMLRNELTGPIEKCIYGTLAKDYTHLIDRDLADRVATP
ncbi:MAG: host attachment protein [Myxococcaceae bacterium]